MSYSLRAEVRRTVLGFLLWPCLASGAQYLQSREATLALPELPQITFDSLLPPARAAIQDSYNTALARPRDASTNGKLGMVLHANNLLTEAQICYRRARSLDPGSLQWTYYLGLTQADLGNWGDAAATLHEAVRLNPEYLPAQLRLVGCLLASSRWQEAAQLYEAILRKHPDSADAHYGLGRARAVRKDLSGAVVSFRRACALFPNFGPAHYALAQTYKRLGKTDQSLEELALYDRDKTSMPNRGDELLDEIWALSANPQDQMRLGMELARQGKFAEAVAAYEKSLQMDPKIVEAHVSLVPLCGQLGQFAKGEEHFQAAVRLDPKGSAIYFNHGLLLAGQGRFEEAEGAFRKALEINPLYPDAHTNLGYMLEAQNKLSGAMAEYRKALENNPTDPQAHFSLGRILVNQEAYKEGIEHLQKSLSGADKGSEPSYLYALGAAYARSGDGGNGLRYLLQAREKAAARAQRKLVESIEEDLQTLEREAPSR